MNTEEKEYFWREWKLSTPKEKWSLMKCPKCPDIEVNTLIANKETGVFHCECCGFKGNASTKPRSVTHTNINLNAPDA